MVKSGNPKSLSVTAYILSQKDLLTDLEFVFGQFRTYQLPVKKIEDFTGINFGKLRDFDPLNDQESFAIREITSPEQAIL
jgi:endonuclease G